MNKNTQSIVTATLLGSMIFFGGVSLTLAQTSGGGSQGTQKIATSTTINTPKVLAAMDRIRTRANKEINRRLEALNKVIRRIEEMKRISANDKDGLINTMQVQITALDTLKTKIAGDTDIEVLRADVQSITKSYRIFALVIPKGHIIAAADRTIEIASMMEDTGTKLSARITQAQTDGHDVSVIITLMDDFTIKIADAKIQAQAAIGGVAVLVPDLGDKAHMTANTEALKGARTNIQTAHADLVSAHKDAKMIIEKLKSMKKEGAPTNTSPTVAQ